MLVYQMHEQHGRHIAYTSLEADDNLKNGWKTVEKEEFYAQGNKISEDRKMNFAASQPKEEKKGKKKGK